MSPEITANDLYYWTLVQGVVVLVGVLVVMSVTRYLHRRGKVRCVVSGWRLWISKGGPDGKAVCAFEAYLYNPGSLPTGLSRVSVAFCQGGGQRVSARLKDSTSDDYLRVVSLPPRRGATLSLYAVFEAEEAHVLFDCQCAEFVGRFPDGRIFKQKIVGRADFLASRKRLGVSQKDFVASRKKLGASRKNFAGSRKKLGVSRKNYTRPRWRRGLRAGL